MRLAARIGMAALAVALLVPVTASARAQAPHAVAVSGQGQRNAVTTSADGAAIARLSERHNRAFASRDVAGVVSFYSKDVVMMPPDETAVRGRDALQRWFARLFGSAAFQPGSAVPEDLLLAGDLAVERMTLRDGAGLATGKIVHVYRREPDGAWKITWDIWNADAPTHAPR